MNNLLPFDYSKLALGYRAVTREGVYPTEVHRFETLSYHPIVSVINDDPKRHYDDGMYSTCGTPSPYDLFLEPPIRVEWWNVYPWTPTVCIHETLESAIIGREAAKDLATCITQKVTYHGDDKEPISVELVKKEL